MTPRADSDEAKPIRIEWASAVVEDGQLTVEFDDEPPPGWRDGFDSVLERLRRPANAWGQIELDARQVRVANVSRGAEGELRHLLESAVLQANASSRLTAQEESVDHDDDGDDQSTPDQAMTERFRSFAERPR